MSKLYASSVLVIVFASSAVWADCQNGLAELTKMEGLVSVKPAGKVVRQTPKKLPFALCQGDEVHTFSGQALVSSSAKDSMIMGPDSVLVIKGRNTMGVGQGKVLFDIQKRTAANSVQVATRLTVIGVKGTRFLVSDQNKALSVTMDEGVVDVKSTTGPIKLFREKAGQEQADFETYKKEARQAVEAEKKAFDAYKENLQREFVGYVRNIELSAGNSLDLTPGQAVERKADAGQKAALSALKSWGGL